MIKFEVGKTYYMRSVCDHDCVWKFEVIKRTAKTITLGATKHHAQASFRVNVWNDTEQVKPLGSYSMAPILTAEKVVL